MTEHSFNGMLDIDLCGTCKKKSSMKCSDCKITSYCSQICQKRNRQIHMNLMQCSKDKSVVMKEEDKIVFEDILDAQALLSYALLGSGLEFGIYDNKVRERLEEQSKRLLPLNSSLDIPLLLPDLLDKQIFPTYTGAVYYQNRCFGYDCRAFEGHFPTQDPILVSQRNDTVKLTPRLLLEKINNAVIVTDEQEVEQYLNANSRPMLACGIHKDLEEISISQMKGGVMILFSCM